MDVQIERVFSSRENVVFVNIVVLIEFYNI